MTQKLPNDKNYRKVRYHFHFTGKYRGTTHSICNLRFNVPNETPLVFLNGSYCSYYFIIKELEVEFKENLNSFPIEKETRKFDKDGNEIVVTITYKIKLTDSTRFTASSNSNLVDNVAGGIHEITCKDCNHFFKHESVNDKLINYKVLDI